MLNNKIERCARELSRAEAVLQGLIIKLVIQLQAPNVNKNDRIKMAIAFDDYIKEIACVEGLILELKQNLSQYTEERKEQRSLEHNYEALNFKFREKRRAEKAPRSHSDAPNDENVAPRKKLQFDN